MRATLFLPIFAALLGLSACSTVESRIKERPETFANLPEKQKTLVTQGEVTEGMTPAAVYLAWGQPDQVIQGSERKQPVEEWIYEATQTEIVSDYRIAPVIYGRHGRFHGSWDYVFDPIIVSRPYPYKSIRFENGQAVAWRRAPLR